MGKRSRNKAGVEASGSGSRQPCHCGSGLRYRNCHGGKTPAVVHVARPFEGLRGERDLVALREFIPSGTAKATVNGREVIFASLLPGAAPAIARDNGEVLIGLQVQHSYRDASRDLAATLELALAAEPGQVLGLGADPGEGVRLQDLLDDGIGDVVVHEDFGYWLPEDAEVTDGMREALEQANHAITATRAVAGVESAYWTDVLSKEYLRWVVADEESAALDALAKLHVAGADRLVEGARLVGMFRTCGLIVPVWDLLPGTGSEVIADPLAVFAERFAELIEAGGSLTLEERGARAGLLSRQLTLR